MELTNCRVVDLSTGLASEPQTLLIEQGRLTRGTHHVATCSLDLDGRFILPGLWDAHVHYGTWALASTHLDLGRATTADEALAMVAAGLADRRADDVLVGMNLRDNRWDGGFDTAALDEVAGGRPVVVFTFDLHALWANTAGLRYFGRTDRTDGSPQSGHLVEHDVFDVQQRVFDVPADAKDAHVREAEARDAARGLVGIVDFDRDQNHDNWLRRLGTGSDRLRVRTSCWPDATLTDTIDRGFYTGKVLDGAGFVTVGPLKIISDGSLSARTAWCRDPYATGLDGAPNGAPNLDEAELVDLLTRASTAGLDAAVHAIGDRAASQAIDAFAETGAHGSIEHAQLLAPTDIARMAELGLLASVQPAHLLGDRTVMDVQWSTRAADAFPLRSLARAGVALAFGSDAPVIPLDPWAAISAAIQRAEPGDEPWHAEQALSLSEALRASTNGVTDLVAGANADLIATAANPFELDIDDLTSIEVDLTLVGGRITHQS